MTGRRLPPDTGIRPALRLAALLAATTLACAPEGDPVPTTMPPRDTGAAPVRRLTIDAGSIEAFTYVRRGDISASDRLFVGSWEGIDARAFIRFQPDSFLSTSDGMSLESAVVLDATLAFNCVPGQGAGALDVRVVGVAGGAESAWAEDSLSWPGPVTEGDVLDDSLEGCNAGDDFPERELEVPPSAIEAWFAGSDDNNGLALVPLAGGSLRGGGGAMLQIASSENNFAFLDSVGSLESPLGPRLRFRAVLEGGSGDTVSVFIPSTSTIADAYVVSPDSAMLPCIDPADCLQIGRGAAHRTIFRLTLPELPRGANVHRALLRLSALGHPRSDRALDLQVFRLTSPFPDEAPADSLVETTGVLFHTATFDSAGTGVEIPVTSLVQGWYDGLFENEGLLVRASAEDETMTTESFAGPSHPSVVRRPEVTLVYTIPYGGRP